MLEAKGRDSPADRPQRATRVLGWPFGPRSGRVLAELSCSLKVAGTSWGIWVSGPKAFLSSIRTINKSDKLKIVLLKEGRLNPSPAAGALRRRWEPPSFGEQGSPSS